MEKTQTYQHNFTHKSEIEGLIHLLQDRFDLTEQEILDIEKVHHIYPVKVNSYYFNLIQEKKDAIWNICIPSIEEITDLVGEEDPLAEERDSPVPLITHRYPDRVLFLISDTCEMYCRFCTRKRKVGTERLQITHRKLNDAFNYIKSHTEVRDVILSGGDALCIPLTRLDYILRRIREINHVEIIRIGSRIPVTNPALITPKLCAILKKYPPLYLNTHFEHPNEITAESIVACNMLADSGVVLGNQNVLLKNINDDAKILGDLYKKLLTLRVKPYYLFQADYVKGTNHFRVPIRKGLEIYRSLQGFTSGLAIPHYVVDAPNGGGKIPLLPQYVEKFDDTGIWLRNFRNEVSYYPEK